MNLQVEYFRLCDLHNNAVISGDHASADKYWLESSGFLNGAETMGANIGALAIEADRYVMAKFDCEVSICGGRLLKKPVNPEHVKAFA